MQKQRIEKTITEAERAKESSQPTPTTQLLLARLAIEAALRHHRLVTRVAANQIFLQSEDSYTLIEVTKGAAHRLAVRIQTVLGKVLLAAEASAYLDTVRMDGNPFEFQLTDEGVLSVVWARDFSGEVDPEMVVAALGELYNFIRSIHTALKEESYLQPVRTQAVARTGGVA